MNYVNNDFLCELRANAKSTTYVQLYNGIVVRRCIIGVRRDFFISVCGSIFVCRFVRGCTCTG